MRTTKLLTLLALLLTAATGAWAQSTTHIVKQDNVNTIFSGDGNKYTAKLKEGVQDADKWTIAPAEATTDGVYRNTKVTLKYNGRLKVKSVTATSDAAPAATVKTITIAADFHTNDPVATAPEITIEYNEGEKWSDVAARYDWLKMYETYTVYYEADGKSGDLHTADGGVKPSDLVDPTKSYYWGFE